MDRMCVFLAVLASLTVFLKSAVAVLASLAVFLNTTVAVAVIT